MSPRRFVQLWLEAAELELPAEAMRALDGVARCAQ